MREDIQPGYAKQMQTDIRAIKERLGMQWEGADSLFS
jgi:hypothetical protein